MIRSLLQYQILITPNEKGDTCSSAFLKEADYWLSPTWSVATTFGSSMLGSPPAENELHMKKPSKSPKAGSRSQPRIVGGMRSEYDFRGGVRNKYAKRFSEGTNMIVLEPDLAAEFPDSQSVSRALRAYLKTRPKRRTV